MRCFIMLLFIVMVSSVYAENQQAVTDTGKTVILKADGTWIYANGVSPKKEIPITVNYTKFKKTKDATFQVKSTKNSSSVWIDPKKWGFKKSSANAAAEYQFQRKGKDLYAMLIAEGIGMKSETLADIAFSNAKKAAPNGKIVKKEYRNVNGKKVIYMEMVGTMQGIDFVYRGYYYSDKKGSTQLVTYTSVNLVEKYQKDIEEILNGLVLR